MSQPYNSLVVLEKTPNGLLKKFLSHFAVFSDLDWNGLKENDVEPIRHQIQQSQEVDRRLISVRLRQVHTLAESRGTKVLIAAASKQGLEIKEQMAAKKNAYERAFWCLVEYPNLFDSEKVYAYTYSLPKASQETRIGFPTGKVKVTEETVSGLKQHIKDAFKDEGRGDECKMDHREHDGVHLFHAYPSNYVDEVDSYGEDGQLGGISVKPPFHIVYYLDQTTGNATVYAKGGSDKMETLFSGFGKAIFSSAAAPPTAGKKTYDLSVFKNPEHKFDTDLKDQIRRLRVTAMRISFHGKLRHRARFEVDAGDPHDDLYKVLQTKLHGGLDELAKSTILDVNLQAVFGGPGGKEEKIDFKISTPRWCTLEHDGREGILRRYLRAWGIELDGKRVAALPKTARVG